jgi:hypothetical protein
MSSDEEAKFKPTLIQDENGQWVFKGYLSLIKEAIEQAEEAEVPVTFPVEGLGECENWPENG